MNPNSWIDMVGDTYTLSNAIKYAKYGKIAAIKSLRFIVQNESMLGLKDAKDIVENIMSQGQYDVATYLKEFERLNDVNSVLIQENSQLRATLSAVLSNMTKEQLISIIIEKNLL